ncbi:MAG: hypothetical protein JOZ01_08615 [Candidatus Eremiobacteraeota bacterium]|nr:hypothetical protein [Candidatus Eremiobacteraeota bacterium]
MYRVASFDAFALDAASTKIASGAARETLLYSFRAAPDGVSSLVVNKQRTLYGGTVVKNRAVTPT